MKGPKFEPSLLSPKKLNLTSFSVSLPPPGVPERLGPIHQIPSFMFSRKDLFNRIGPEDGWIQLSV